MAFTFTSLPLNFYTSVSGCGCDFGFEQKFWRIDGFGEEKKHGSADLRTSIHPPRWSHTRVSSTHCTVKIASATRDSATLVGLEENSKKK